MCRSLLLALTWLLLSCSSSAAPIGRPAQGNAPPSSRGAAAPSQLAPQGAPTGSGLGASSVLDHVRPKGPGCRRQSEEASLEQLVDDAEKAFEEGSYQRALACTEEALHADARYVPALGYRAAALAALDRLDEARAAYDRALAVDPNDPEALWGAADLYVSRLGDRESLEVGLEHALRGARLALAPAHRDRELAGQLYLLAGMAENDLGRSNEALAHLDLALARLPGDTDVIYERGVALYELCRFTAARRAFETVLRRIPDDAWALHYLGLVAERSGDEPRARKLMARAVKLAPGKIQPEIDLDRSAFEEEVRRAIAALPHEEKRSLAGVPVQIEELPAIADLTAVTPPLSPSILGLFRGPPEPESCAPGEASPCRAIVFYRKNLARFARDRRELAEQIRVTLLHELGHLHGENDDELRDRGLE
jgi:tetratricopeptide (TPR) repeat protein